MFAAFPPQVASLSSHTPATFFFPMQAAFPTQTAVSPPCPFVPLTPPAQTAKLTAPSVAQKSNQAVGSTMTTDTLFKQRR